MTLRPYQERDLAAVRAAMRTHRSVWYTGVLVGCSTGRSGHRGPVPADRAGRNPCWRGKVTSEDLNNRPWSIYALKDPRTDEVRYVGWTGSPASRRLTAHISDARYTKWDTEKSRWIKSLLEEKLRPIIEVIESGSGVGWLDAERRWIRHYRSIGTLTNISSGGHGPSGIIASAETRAKQSAARIGRRMSAESRAKVSASKRGVKRPPFSQEYKDLHARISARAALTCCSKRHPFDEKNTYYTLHSNGRSRRSCRICRAQRQREYIARKKKRP